MEDQVNTYNVGFGVEIPESFIVMEGTGDNHRIMFAESRYRLVNWNILK